MKKLIFLLLIAFAAWYGYKHYPELMNRRPGHDAVIENQSGLTMQAIRLTVDGQTFVKEELANEASVDFPFKVSNDASFTLVWAWKEKPGEAHWSGGMVPKGPMMQRHRFQIDGDGAVTYTPENK
jgi:hypothetical protein